MKLDSPFYLERPADKTIAKLAVQHGVTVLVKGPRQVGKTSLLARAQACARQKGLTTFYVDFQLADETRFASLEILLRYLG